MISHASWNMSMGTWAKTVHHLQTFLIVSSFSYNVDIPKVWICLFINISYSDMSNQTRQFQGNILSMLHLLLFQNRFLLSMETTPSI